MRLIKAKIKPTFVQRLTRFFEESSTWREEKNNLEPLIELIQLIRPIKTKGLKEVNLFELISFLKIILPTEKSCLFI